MIFFFKQKTAYEMRISDWSSDVCSSDLLSLRLTGGGFRDGGGRIDLRHFHDLIITVVRRKILHVEGVRCLVGKFTDPVVIELDFNPCANGRFVSSDERRVGKECVSTFRSRWSPSHEKKKKSEKTK